MSNQFSSTFEYKLIYVVRFNIPTHQGFLKIGDATIKTSSAINTLAPSCRELNQAAKERINSYTSTAGIQYELLYTDFVIYHEDEMIKVCRDYKIHEVLKRSGILPHYFDTENRQNEWFPTDLETVKNAIKAIREGRKSLLQTEITADRAPIAFRPEQLEAIKETISQYKKSNRMLWNAKMRFGKTLSALQVMKQMEFKRSIIFTHRPVVIDGWFDDFGKIFYDREDYLFGSKMGKGEELESLVRSDKSFFYFASIQDLRGSDQVGGNFEKNDLVFQIDWDFVIIDEAHEGTQTDLGDNVIKAVVKSNTKVLELSGTPFNLLSNYDEKEIYTWDYVMEQRAKRDWAINHYGDSNPYEELPELNIYTYYLDKLIHGYVDLEDKAFNFREFFRTWTGHVQSDRKAMPNGVSIGDFVHKDDVWSFLNLITKSDNQSHYPFATEAYRNFFRHSLWMVPGVKEAKALSAMMRQHPVFGSGAFNIVNVAGEGDEEQNTSDALDAVRKAIGKHPEENYTITLSCGRLTTGVSVPEWTAVFMLSGTFSTSASNYLQTIFRVQTPANIGGKIKEKCYVFDFAPDRTLKMIAEASKISAKAGKTTSSDRQIMGDFLNFCPVVAIDGTNMKPFDVGSMLEQLKRAYTDKVVKNGFDDKNIYNDSLLQLDGLAIEEFNKLRAIIGASKQTKKQEDIVVNKHDLTDEQYEQLEEIRKKSKAQLTEEDKQRLEEAKEKQKQKQTAISILRGISIRIPLLVYGADISFEEEITADNFPKLIDPLSWDEFMPRGVTKELFKKFSKYYDPDIFVAAGRQIRNIAKSADALSVTERVKKIASLFATFKNPDKETVLTPWRVVNMHISDCLGGYDFFDQQHEKTLDEPRWVEHEEVTAETLGNKDAYILEINSKTGLYPLYVAYSLFRAKCKVYPNEALDGSLETRLWNETVSQNVFVICKTPMAKSITRRTLIGYSDAKVNTRYFEDLINQITNKSDNFLSKISDGKGFWKANNDINMKFKAIVGNPPYQVMDGGNNASSTPVYNLFVEMAKKLCPNYVSMIIPAKWYNGGKGLDDFRTTMLSDTKMRKLIDFADSNECFIGVDIAGGICFFLWDEEYSGLCSVENVTNGNRILQERNLSEYKTFIRDSKALSIIEKVLTYEDTSYYNSRVSSRKPFGLATNVKPTERGDITLRYSGGKGLFERSRITTNSDWIDKWKVIASYLTHDHAGRADKDGRKRIISTLELLSPNEACTETYLVLDVFDTELEAQNLIRYIKTRFVRFHISQLTSTQHITKGNYALVPLQDFTKSWTDAELYAKYGLTDEEIGFIEEMIKPME